MRLLVTVVPGPGASSVDVRVEVDEGCTVAELDAALQAHLPRPPHPQHTQWSQRPQHTQHPQRPPHPDSPAAGGRHLRPEPQRWWLDGEGLRPDATLTETGVRDGSVLHRGAPGPPPDDGTGVAVHVVAGPDAGLVLPVPPDGVLGRETGLSDMDVSRRHLRLHPDGALTDAGSTNGSLLDGKALPTDRDHDRDQDQDGVAPSARVARMPADLPPCWGHGIVQVGQTLLALRRTEEPDTAVRDDGAYNRPPRLPPPPTQVVVRLPKPPVEQEGRSLPVIAILAPLLVGVGMAFVLGPRFLLFAILSPVMLIGNYVSDRRRGKRSARTRTAEHETATAAAMARYQQACDNEVRRRRLEHPDPGLVRQIALGPRARLWERRREDPDALEVSLGLAELPLQAQLVPPEDQYAAPTAPARARDLPVVLPLREVGVLGLVGEHHETRAHARWILGQLAVLHSPRDLSVCVLTDSSAVHDWGWLRWLPHARTLGVGNDSRSTAQRVAELGATLTERARAEKGTLLPYVVVVLDGACALRELPGVTALLRDGPAVGIVTVCLEREQRLLPEECRASLSLPGRTLHRALHASVEHIAPQPVTACWSEQVARALAPLRDVTATAGTSLPSSARLLDLLGLEPSAEGVRRAWLSPPSTRVVLGAGSDGPVVVDLASDGPHGLIAGTTGSGKSELLQTVVASLAVANRPETLNLVLVDYKGGSAFKDCVRLPHVVGMVTDLDTQLVGRALTSLGAELRRREHQLAAAGHKDIEDHLAAGQQMARLVLVIDEFASLARELPEFVSGLISIAQRGRSLGIHLLLATQRPSGAVSPEIRANTDLRIALRVTDPAESSDVLDAPDAARIDRGAPGRGFLRLAHGSLVPFQAGRVGGRRPGSTGGRVPYVRAVSWETLGYPLPSRPDAPDAEETDLAALVDAIREAAGPGAQRSPWLPALPETLLMDELPPGAWGLRDVPAKQTQEPVRFDLATAGHLLVLGGARSGRSQLLRTLVGALVTEHGPDTLHLYALDCGNGALAVLETLPHHGAVVSRSEPERAARLLRRFAAELTRRQHLLAAGGHAGLEELHEPPPHLVLLMDRWEGFISTLGELDSGALTDLVLLLLREGASVGVHVVITGDRSLGLGRVGATTEHKLALRLPDRADYGLLGIDHRQVPAEPPPGRAWAADGGLATQVALLDPDPSGAAQAAALTRLGRWHPAPRRAPFRVDVLPAQVTLCSVLAPLPPLHALVGVGGDELAPLTVDLSRTPSLLIAGPARSGRSTALVGIAQSLLLGGTRLVLVAPRASALSRLPGVPFTGLDLDVLQEQLAEPGPVVVVIDDAEQLRDCGAVSLLRQVVAGALPGRAVVLAGNASEVGAGFTGWQVDARKARHGLLLSPQDPADGELVGLRLPRSLIDGPVLPGRGLLHLGDGALVPVQVPC